MDKCIKWYKRISMLSLFLLMFGILLINICIIGLSVGSNNIAYALTSTGYYENNYVPNSDCTVWDFDQSVNNSSSVLYEDSFVQLVLSGYGFISNNVLTGSGGVVSLSYVLKDSFSGTSVGYAVGYSSSTDTCNMYAYNMLINTLLARNNYRYYRQSGTNSLVSGNVLIGVDVPNGVSLTLRYFYVSNNQTSTYTGYVPNSYSTNGYDQGFTDGVNSASGGSDMSGIVDLTDVTWRAPDTSNQTTLIDVFDVTGSFDSLYLNGATFTFDKVQVDSDNSIFGYDDGGLITSPLYLINSSMSVSEGTIPVLENDLITFTGGDDATNSDLISWLQANSSFLNYTDGYQEGYNNGHDIGYQEGYDKAMSLVNNFSSIYNIVGGFIYNTNFGSSVTDDLSGEGIQVNVPEDYGSGYGYDSISGTIGYTSGHINIYTTSQKPSYLLASNLNPYGTYFYLYDPTDLSANINTSQLYINICPSGSSQSVRLLPLHNDLIINNCYAMNLSGLYGGNYDVYICMQVTGSTMYLSLSNTWNTGVGIGGLYQHLGDEGSYSLGYTDGYSSGYDYGMDLGYDVGYRAGQDDTNPYSFYDLFGAIYDVPVRTFNGMFDLNILGINLKGFILGLISLCIVLFILKIVFR